MILKTIVSGLLAFAVCIPLFSQAAPGKVGTINVQVAMISTREGQAGVKELQDRFNPKQKQLQDKQGEIQSLQQQLQRGANTMSEDALRKLRQDIDDKQRVLQRDSEDAQMEFEQQQQRVFSSISERMQAVIDKYAREQGYVLIIDIGSAQSSVLFASNTIDITQDVIKAFDADTSTPAAAPAPAPAKP